MAMKMKTKETTQETTDVIYTLDKAEAAWLALAIDIKYPARPVLIYAALIWLHGQAVLATTDSHRLHLLYLGKSAKFDTVLIDIRRIIHDASFWCKGSYDIEINVTSGTVLILTSIGDRFEVLYNVFPQGSDLKFPNVGPVIPVCTTPPSGHLGINGKYFRDGTLLSERSARRCILCQEKEGRPLLIKPGDDPRWIAVIMPMTTAQPSTRANSNGDG